MFKIYYIGNKKEYRATVLKCLIKIYILSALTVCLVFGPDPSVYTAAASLFLVYFIYRETITSTLCKLELKFLKAFDSFLGIMRHYYYKSGSILDALVLSEIDADLLIKGHIREMSGCLSSSDSVSKTETFLNSQNHKYLKLFLTLARLVSENGDIVDENGSVFLNSCMHLKYDVEEDARFISEKNHRFSGLMLTAVLPVIAVPYIAKWGVSAIPSLNQFYNGYTGTALSALMLTVSFICYNALSELKSTGKRVRKKYCFLKYLSENRIIKRIPEFLMNLTPKKTEKIKKQITRLCEDYDIKVFYMKKAVLFVLGFYICISVLYLGHSRSAYIYKNDKSEISELTSLADSREITAMENLIPQFTGSYIDDERTVDRDELIEQFMLEKDIKNIKVAEAAADDVIKRVVAYGKEKLNIKDFLISVLIAFLSYCFPEVALFFKNSLIESRTMDEVMQFQSIIHMLKRVPGISVVSLLEEMELFSEIFRPIVKQCLDEFSISDEAALSRMYEAEKNPEFRRLTDCFLMADELGIEDAFEEISAEIVNFRENRKLDRKIMLDSEGMLGAVIAVLPGGLILFGYLLGPFMIRSMQIFNEYQSGIVLNT